MKVLLLIPPTDLTRSYGRLKKFSNPQPSLGIAYIASILKNNNYEVKVVDAYVNEYSLREIMELIGDFSPDIIGISVLTPSVEVVCEISKSVRKFYPYIKIVMGNIHASLFCNDMLSMDYADFIVHREGELTMLELLEALRNRKSLGNVKGLSFKIKGEITNNPQRDYIENLDSLPFPAWELLPMDKYSTDPRTEIKRGVVERQILATRGCPYQCTFCSSHTDRSLGNKYRMRSTKNIVDEIEYMYKNYGSTVFSFMDLAFPLVRQHAMLFCDEMIKRRLNEKINWCTECRVKPIDRDLLSLMVKSGCARICFGIESGNDKTLDMLKKNFTVEDVRVATKLARSCGLEVDGMFMIGLPEETEEMINHTIDFAISLDLRYAIFNIFVPYPGCDLYAKLKSENKIHFKSWADFTSYPTYSGGIPVYAPDGLSKERLMNLQRVAMKKFYIRPKFIFKEIANFKINKVYHYLNGLKGILFD